MKLLTKEEKDRQRARAISKLHAEIAKDISSAVDIARSCGLWDFLRLLYELRLARLVMILPEYRDELTPADMITFHLNDDGMKYAISLVAKHGQWADLSAVSNPLVNFDISRVHTLEAVTRHINAKYETEIILNIADVEVVGDRDQHCLVNLEAGARDPIRNMYLQFGLRLERFTRDKKNDPVLIPDLVERFRDEYADLSEMYESDNGITLDEYCQGMLDIHQHLVSRGMEAEAQLLEGGKDQIDPLSSRTFIKLSRTFILTDAELSATFAPNFLGYLRRNPFNPAAISDSELRYHYISRRPFLFGEGFAIFSPELVFDSVMGNTRYTFLESVKSKQKFMELSASQFIDKVSNIAVDFGYSEVARDIYLKESKKDIGDIDLFLWHAETGRSLLIEAKNHTLPLPVYFRSPQAVDDHIARNRDWESKVKRRISHLKANDSSFHVLGDWDYLVVTLMPEPLSHVTDLLVLSLDEFESWLRISPRPESFSQLHEIIHDPRNSAYTLDDLQRIRDEGFVLLNPLSE